MNALANALGRLTIDVIMPVPHPLLPILRQVFVHVDPVTTDVRRRTLPLQFKVTLRKVSGLECEVRPAHGNRTQQVHTMCDVGPLEPFGLAELESKVIGAVQLMIQTDEDDAILIVIQPE